LNPPEPNCATCRLTHHQPDRASLREAQSSSPKSRRALHSGTLRPDRLDGSTVTPFPHPAHRPDVQISRIRFSDKTSRFCFRVHTDLSNQFGIVMRCSSLGSSWRLRSTSRLSYVSDMNCKNSPFDTVPFLSMSIMRNNCCTSDLAAPAVRLLAANAAVDTDPTTSNIPTKATRFRVIDMAVSVVRTLVHFFSRRLDSYSQCVF
jgi:hypothetical protein